MQRRLHLGPAPIDPGPSPLLREDNPRAASGALITFFGIVRGTESGARIGGLDYEAFVAMAERQFEILFDAVERRWPRVEAISLVHRTGPVRAGEPSLRVDILAERRAEAFAACQWLIDEMKRVVPIWKHPIPDSNASAPEPSQAEAPASAT